MSTLPPWERRAHDAASVWADPVAVPAAPEPDILEPVIPAPTGPASSVPTGIVPGSIIPAPATSMPQAGSTVPPAADPVTDGVAPQRDRLGIRRRWDGLSLRARLVAILVALLTLALVATGAATQTALRRYLLDQVDEQLRQQAGLAASFAYRDVVNPLDNRGPRDGGLPGGFVVQIWLVDSTDRTTIPSRTANPPRFETLTAAQVEARGLAPYTLESVTGGQEWRVIAAPIVDDRTNTLLGYAQIASPLQNVENNVHRLLFFIFGLGGAIVALCALLGWVAIRRSFAPLEQVETTAAAIAAGDLSQRVPERPATTEVGRLTSSLNTMLTKIEDAFRAREASEARTRRFAADASHELRTPLASIRGFAELYRQGAVPTDEVPRTMRRIEDEAKRMGGLVEDLLLLARLDERRPGRAEPVDLAVLADDAVHDARGLDPGRVVRLVGLDDDEPSGTAMVIGDEDRLRQVVANLVSNAVRHTPPGTPVEVAVGTRDGRAVLEVRDHGLGLTPEQSERVFERFYRADSSRHRAQGGGSGLGLSIVAAVVSAHRGEVGAQPTPGGGATFTVRLPAAAQGPVTSD